MSVFVQNQIFHNFIYIVMKTYLKKTCKNIFDKTSRSTNQLIIHLHH